LAQAVSRVIICVIIRFEPGLRQRLPAPLPAFFSRLGPEHGPELNSAQLPVFRTAHDAVFSKEPNILANYFCHQAELPGLTLPDGRGGLLQTRYMPSPKPILSGDALLIS
jgi:hypothetical protein